MAQSGAGLEAMEAFIRRINMVLVGVASVVLISMAMMVTYDVFVRYVLNAPLPASVEISQLMEPWVVFLPFAYTLAVGSHVRVTLFTVRLPRRWFNLLEILAYAVDGLFFALLCYYAWEEFYASWAVGEIMLAAIRLPWWVGKLSMPVGMLCIFFQCLLQIAVVVREIRERK